MAYIQQRETDDGAVHFRVQVRLKGHPTQTATFERKTDARRWAQQVESAIREVRHFKTSEAKRHTVADLVDRYIRDVLPRKPKSQKKQAAQLAWWKERLGPYTLADITPARIVECRDELGRGTTPSGKPRSPATLVRYMAALSHAFSMAVREWGWLESNPMRNVTRPQEPRGRVRFLADDERTRLLAACRESVQPDLYPAVVLALSTGARKTEIIGARWQAVDLQRGVIVLEHTKNGDRRVLPLMGHARDIMRERAKVVRIGTDLVFPGTDPKRPINLRSAWEAALEKAQVTDFRWHDLRHTAASYLAMNGATLAEIAEVLGHKTLQMVKRYAHLSEAHTARVVGSMNAKIFGHD
jgi:integrase